MQRMRNERNVDILARPTARSWDIMVLTLDRRFALSHIREKNTLYTASMQFTASVIKGSGRGKYLGTPTINLNVAEVPQDLEYGIYACKCQFSDVSFQMSAVLHYGPRPVFKDTVSCESHLLDEIPSKTPDSLTVEIIQKLRDVQDFASVEALKEQILNDIAEARAILKSVSW